MVRTHQTFLHDDAVVFVLEHLDGISLAELLARHTMKWRRCLSDDASFTSDSASAMPWRTLTPWSMKRASVLPSCTEP